MYISEACIKLMCKIIRIMSIDRLICWYCSREKVLFREIFANSEDKSTPQFLTKFTNYNCSDTKAEKLRKVPLTHQFLQSSPNP